MSKQSSTAEVPTDDSSEPSALDRVADAVGGYAALARMVDTTPQAVNKWKTGGIPPERVISVAKASGISPFDLRPDLYPRDYLATFFVHAV
jgi:DNA-binding transcriptional regulator YdaS (Cro superfamily)